MVEWEKLGIGARLLAVAEGRVEEGPVIYTSESDTQWEVGYELGRTDALEELLDWYQNNYNRSWLFKKRILEYIQSSKERANNV